MFFEMRFDLGTLDSGERSLPFGLLVTLPHTFVGLNHKGDQFALGHQYVYILLIFAQNLV